MTQRRYVSLYIEISRAHVRTYARVLVSKLTLCPRPGSRYEIRRHLEPSAAPENKQPKNTPLYACRHIGTDASKTEKTEKPSARQ